MTSHSLSLCLNIISSKNNSLTLEDGVRCYSGVFTSELHLTSPMAPITLYYRYVFPCLYSHNGTYRPSSCVLPPLFSLALGRGSLLCSFFALSSKV